MHITHLHVAILFVFLCRFVQHLLSMENFKKLVLKNFRLPHRHAYKLPLRDLSQLSSLKFVQASFSDPAMEEVIMHLFLLPQVEELRIKIHVRFHLHPFPLYYQKKKKAFRQCKGDVFLNRGEQILASIAIRHQA